MGALDDAAYLAQLQSLLPPGKIWSRDPYSDITKLLTGISPELARVQGRADDLLRELNPGEASELLPEHESINGIVGSGTDAARQAALLAKLQDRGGHNPADYTAWAASLGFAGVTVHRRPYSLFTAGSTAGEHDYDEQWAHVQLVDYMTDLLVPDADDFSAWSLFSGTVTANSGIAPDGTTTADQMSGSSWISSSLGTNYYYAQFSVWLRAASTTPVTLGAGAFFTDIEIDDVWRRYEFRPSSAVSDVYITASDTYYAWRATVGARNSSFESAFADRQQAHAVPLYRVIGDWPGD